MIKLEDLQLRASAIIEPGAQTGRVRVIGPKGGLRRGKRPPRRSPQQHVYAERIGITMTPTELADLDLAAKLVHMNRSEFVRRALTHFYAKIFAPGWREVGRRRR